MSHLSFIAYFHLCELNTCQNHDFQNFMFMNHFCGLFVNVSSLSDYYYNIINKNQKDSENDCRIAVMFSVTIFTSDSKTQISCKSVQSMQMFVV